MSSADRARRRLIKEQLMSWVVLACFRVAEKLSDVALGWLPLYDEAKVMIFVSMLAWRSAGAQLVYTNVLAPFIKPYERPLDLVGHALNEVLEVAVYLLLIGPRWLHKKVSAFRKPDIPNILASLRKPGQHPIAHQVATSIELAKTFPSSSSSASSNPKPPPPFRPLTESRTVLKTVEQHPPVPSSSSSQPFRPMTNARLSSKRSVSGGLSSIPTSTSTTQLRRVSSRSTLRDEPKKVEGLYPSLTDLATQAPLSTTDRKGKGRERPSDQYLDPTIPFPRSTIIPPNIPRPIILPPPDPISQSISIPPLLAPVPLSPAQISPPRTTLSTQPPIPETPAPPGAFVSRSFSRTPTKSAPFRDPNIDEMDVDLQESAATVPLTIVPPTPRQKALSAIADLSGELDAANDEKPDWATSSKSKSKAGSALIGRNGKRKVSDDLLGEMEGSPGKRKRVSTTSNGLSRSTSSSITGQKALPRSRTTSRLGTGDEANHGGSSKMLAKSRSSAALSRSRSSAALSRKKVIEKEEGEEEDDGDETAKEDVGCAAPTRRKRSTTTASTASSIPLPRSRSSATLPSSSNSTSRRSGAPPPSSSNSHPPDADSTAPSSSDSDSDLATRPTAASKARHIPTASSDAEGTNDAKGMNGAAPARKAKRVLLRPTQDVEEDDSGIPIVGRKKMK